MRDLNGRARQVLKERGELGDEVSVPCNREVGQSDGSILVERSERILAPGDHLMFLKNNRDLGVKNGSLGTVTEITADAIAVRTDGKEWKEVEFRLADYSALDYGYAATIHKAQGATVERAFVLATPGMDRHLAYVAMTRHREHAEIYASQEDFSDFGTLKDRLSRERMKDITLDYADRRGLQAGENQERASRTAADRDPLARFKAAQQEFIRVAGRAHLDAAAKPRTNELRAKMRAAAAEIAKSGEQLRAAERAGIGGQIRNFVRRAERDQSLSKGHGREKEDGPER